MRDSQQHEDLARHGTQRGQDLCGREIRGDGQIGRPIVIADQRHVGERGQVTPTIGTRWVPHHGTLRGEDIERRASGAYSDVGLGDRVAHDAGGVVRDGRMNGHRGSSRVPVDERRRSRFVGRDHEPLGFVGVPQDGVEVVAPSRVEDRLGPQNGHVSELFRLERRSAEQVVDVAGGRHERGNVTAA